MFCKKCGRELEDNVVYCPECGELNHSESVCQRKPKVNVKKNIIDNIYKMGLAVASIVTFFLPWINWAETQMNFFGVNIIIRVTEKLKDNIFGIFSGDIGNITKLMNLDVSKVMKLIDLCWEDGDVFVQSSKWILLIIVATILINIIYVVVLILGKEKKWMLVGLIILNLIVSAVITIMICMMPSERIGLGYGPVVMYLVQAVLGELSAQREVDLCKKES